nr:transmembrane protein [Quercus suber]
MAVHQYAPDSPFDIDHYLNPFIPRSPLHHLPIPLSYFLGYRSKVDKEPPIPIQWLTTLLSTTAGLCLVSATFIYAPGLSQYNPPVIIASFGASAVLHFNAIRAPLAQPRNAIFGHALSAVIGVSIAKLFFLSSTMRNFPWVGGAVACACASTAMSLTNTVHPPGGATALLASTEASIVALGWMFIPFVLVGSLLMLVVALLANNITRRYPMYWWTTKDVGGRLPWYNHRTSSVSSDLTKVSKSRDVEAQKDVDSDTSSARSIHETLSHTPSSTVGDEIPPTDGVCISASRFHIPGDLQLSEDEILLLQKLQQKMCNRSMKGNTIAETRQGFASYERDLEIDTSWVFRHLHFASSDETKRPKISLQKLLRESF